MRREGQLFMLSQLDEPDSTFGNVLTDSYTYVNELTAELYGLQVSGEAFERVSLPAEQRFVLLSQPYFLATRATNESDPISRGSFVRERVLCQDIPDVPPSLGVLEPAIDDTTTTREFYEAWVSDPSCWTCHRY